MQSVIKQMKMLMSTAKSSITRIPDVNDKANSDVKLL